MNVDLSEIRDLRPPIPVEAADGSVPAWLLAAAIVASFAIAIALAVWIHARRRAKRSHDWEQRIGELKRRVTGGEIDVDEADHICAGWVRTIVAADADRPADSLTDKECLVRLETIADPDTLDRARSYFDRRAKRRFGVEPGEPADPPWELMRRLAAAESESETEGSRFAAERRGEPGVAPEDRV